MSTASQKILDELSQLREEFTEFKDSVLASISDISETQAEFRTSLESIMDAVSTPPDVPTPADTTSKDSNSVDMNMVNNEMLAILTEKLDQVSNTLSVLSGNFDNLKQSLSAATETDDAGESTPDTPNISLSIKAKPVLKTKAKAASSTPKAGTPIQRGKITVNYYDNTIVIPAYGTFDRKDIIKKYGGQWRGDSKEWIVPLSNGDAMIAELKRYCEEVTVDKRSGTREVSETPSNTNSSSSFTSKKPSGLKSAGSSFNDFLL